VEPEKLKQIVEAALLAADEPLTVDQLVKLFAPGEIDKDTIRADLRAAIDALTEEADGRGYELAQVASGYRYQVRQELSAWISRLWEERPPRYTRALLETLALVAYKQPVTRGDIEQVRGVSVSQNIMRTLLERGWIRVVGQREVPGRPSMYGTTREFLDYFNLKSLDQLPPLAEIRELIEPVLAEEEQMAEELDRELDSQGQADAETPLTDEAEQEEAAAAALDGLEEDDEVDLDGEGFDAEIAAALAAADAASERFNRPETEEEAGADDPAEGTAAVDTAQVEAQPGRPQVVDVVTELDGPETPSNEGSGTDPDSGKATAEVVQLPRAPH
jgi:segregation and condensation protein B